MDDTILNFNYPTDTPKIIKVIGVGGGGGNAVTHMYKEGIHDVTFVLCNTDNQALNRSDVPIKLLLGREITQGLGAGNKPERAMMAAEESLDDLRGMLNDGTKMVFITAGMGGGTGTGAAPVVAQIAKEMGILTIAVVTKPFNFEGKKRLMNAERGIENLRKHVDTLVVIPNDKLLKIAPKGTPIVEAFRYADDVLRQGIQGISDLIVTPSLINLDFADVRSIMKNRGLAHMGIGHGKGENKTLEAVRQAVSSPLLETTIEGATGVLLNVKGGMDLPLDEVYEAADLVKGVVDADCNIIFGSGIDESMNDEVEITIIATGFAGSGILEEKEKENPIEKNVRAFSNFETKKDFAGTDIFGRPLQQQSEQQVQQQPASQQPLYTNERPQISAEAVQHADGTPSSRIHIENSDIPPFLQRLKKL